MAKAKKEETVNPVIEVTLKKEYAGLTSIIIERNTIEFKNGKATVTAEKAEKIKGYIE